jgi:hypothetical protein
VTSASEPDYSAGSQTGCGTGRDFQPLLERVDQKEHEQPDGERQYELQAAPAHSSQRR